MMETIGKLFTLPSNILVFSLIAALVLLYWPRTRQLSLALALLAAIVYVVFGAGPVSFWLLGRLEYQYPPLVDARSHMSARAIVILSGHGERHPDSPLSSAVNSSSAIRLIEAARIVRQRPELRVIVTGEGEVPGIIGELLLDVGIPPGKIQIDSTSANTYDSAVYLRDLLKDDTFFLVTSAGHMPRAMGTFQMQGLKPIPSPTEFLTRKNIYANRHIPTPTYLMYSDLAVQEHLAILWYRIKDRL